MTITKRKLTKIESKLNGKIDNQRKNSKKTDKTFIDKTESKRRLKNQKSIQAD